MHGEMEYVNIFLPENREGKLNIFFKIKIDAEIKMWRKAMAMPFF